MKKQKKQKSKNKKQNKKGGNLFFMFVIRRLYISKSLDKFSDVIGKIASCNFILGVI